MTAAQVLARIQQERVVLPRRNHGYAADALLVFADYLDQAAREADRGPARDMEALAQGLRNEAKAARRAAPAAARQAIPLRERNTA